MAKHTPVGEQRRLVELWQTSNLSMATFARTHCVLPGTFSLWVSRHGANWLAPPEPTRFVQVPTSLPKPTTALAVRLAGHELSFDAPPPPAWFAAVLRELTPC